MLSQTSTRPLQSRLILVPRPALKAHRESARAARFSPDGRLIVTASADQSILAVDAATGKACARKATAHATGIDRLLFVSDAVLASGKLQPTSLGTCASVGCQWRRTTRHGSWTSRGPLAAGEQAAEHRRRERSSVQSPPGHFSLPQETTTATSSCGTPARRASSAALRYTRTTFPTWHTTRPTGRCWPPAATARCPSTTCAPSRWRNTHLEDTLFTELLATSGDGTLFINDLRTLKVGIEHSAELRAGLGMVAEQKS